MFKSKLLLAALFALAVSSAQATVTLQFSTASEKLTNIQNAAGNATGGLIWGIVVSTTDASFAGGGTNYDGFTIPASGSSVALTFASAATDDRFYYGGGLTLASISGTDGGTNAITSLSNMTFANGMDAGDRFALMWLDTNSAANGQKYGFLSFAAPDFVLPSDGNTTSYSPLFAGADPVRLASNVFGIPEPSRVMLLGLGALGVFFRRRR